MHRVTSRLALLLVLLSRTFAAIDAQSSYPLPGCDANTQVQKVIDRDLDPKLLEKMTFADRFALEQKTLNALIAKYPRELDPQTKLRNLFFQFSPDEYLKLRDKWVAQGKAHPDDPMALFLAGLALNGVDTPESIRLLQQAKQKASGFPWPARDLTGIYVDGKFADSTQAKKNIDAFFAACPASSDPYALYLLPKTDPSLLPKVSIARAGALRAKLEKETDPKQLMSYRSLWTLEFQMIKPQEYAAERQRIAQDMARLETINPKGDAEWQALLITGYKQSGASKEKIAEVENRLIAEYPHSNQAYVIVSDRWNQAHPEPQDQADAAAWDKHRKEYETALQGWLRDYPDDTHLQRRMWFFAVQDDDLIPRPEAIAAVDDFLRNARTYDGPGWCWYYCNQAAQFLVARGLEPDRAIDLVRQVNATYKSNPTLSRQSDKLTRQQQDENIASSREQSQFMNGLMLKAAIEGGKLEITPELRAAVDLPPPEDKKQLEGYWTNRARVALLTGSKVDALAYYQSALQTRLDTPKPSEGRVRDDLGIEAHTLWKQLGGTEAARVTWSGMPGADKSVLADGRWEKPRKSLPSFELTDLSGKTWRLKDLNGKTVLIDVWATWCGPCQAELPNLQKLYEQTKDRSDLQILTFDSDENPGTLGSYLKEKGYTFPVLPIVNAAEIKDAVNDNGIPQNWIVGRTGASLWRQIGYGSESFDDFSKDMLTRMDTLTANQ